VTYTDKDCNQKSATMTNNMSVSGINPIHLAGEPAYPDDF